MARQLIVVSRENVGLYHALCADWAGDFDVAVVLDRRQGQRRHETAAVAVERRREERRQHDPVEAYLAWRGGGAPARRADVLSVLNCGVSSIVVRQRPGAKAEARAPLVTPIGEVRDDSRNDSFDTSPMMSLPANAVVALVILVGTLSGGIVGGLALWLFLAYEFTSRRGRPGSAATRRPEVWWLRPLHKLHGAYRASQPVDRVGKA
jgi:hypothetical protein